ncbi:hypothetical protein, partial [Mycolicibacterium insubricum]|uniref:hypothetical protein n=1 Tax=Mycolicibacterium insubricum TaxID=444597 RepID=UPI002AF321CD|nr:hypothetical protein [Mycolicibacterium insubricum]
MATPSAEAAVGGALQRGQQIGIQPPDRRIPGVERRQRTAVVHQPDPDGARLLRGARLRCGADED